jgi:heat shock protein HslJ
MYCEEGMDQADAFLQVLSKTKQIKIEEDHLILYTADIELARFESKDEY